MRALDGVSIDVREGEILGLIGENGAGKSRLMEIVAGIYQPDAGQLLWQGRPVAHSSPADAVRLGIEVVPQELSLAPQLSAAEMVPHLAKDGAAARRPPPRGREATATPPGRSV